MRGSNSLRKITAATLAAVGLAAIARLPFARRDRADEKRNERDRIDEAGPESFPASDPPSWTVGDEPQSK